MNPTIVKIIDMMYRDIPKNEETDTLREELLTNCQARYEDLLAAGVAPDDALGQVLESLRGMEDVLDTFRTGANTATQTQKDDYRPTVPTMDGGEYTPSFHNLADSVMESAGAAVESAMKTAAAAMETARASMEEACSSVNQPTAPAREGESSVYTFPAGQIQEVNVQLYGDDVEILSTQGDSLRVEIDDNEEVSIVATAEGSVLKVQRVRGSSHIGGHMEIESNAEEGLGSFLTRLGQKLSSMFNNNFGSHSVRLYIPATLRKLTVSTTSGDVDVNGLTVSGDMSLTSASGDLVVDRCTVAGNLRLGNTSGDCDASLTTVSGELVMNSTAGDLYAGEETAAGAVRANTTSGDIDIFTRCSRMALNSVSGDVDALVTRDITQFSANTTSGDIDVRVDDGVTVAVFANTCSGDVDVSCSNSASASIRLTLNTVSGDISVSD